MPPSGPAEVLPPVAEHRVFMFFPFTVEAERGRTQALADFEAQLRSAELRQLASSPLMPSWIREKADKLEGPLWRFSHEAAEDSGAELHCRTVSRDLLPHVRRLAGGDAKNQPEITRCGFFELVKDGVNLRSGAHGKFMLRRNFRCAA